MTKFQLIEKALNLEKKPCGENHDYTRQSDGTLICDKCGKKMNPVKLESCGNPHCKCTPETCKCKQGKKCGCKHSKFESYEADMILEKLGSLDVVDASELGVPANTPITVDMLKTAFKRLFMKTKNADPNAFYGKIKAAFRGATPEELNLIRKQLESAVIDVDTNKVSGDGFGGRNS